MLVGRKWEAYLKARWNLLRARHRDKHGVEIRAVAVLRIAGPERVAVSPTSAALVILHSAKNVFINILRLFEGSGRTFCLPLGELRGNAGDGHQTVWLQEPRQLNMRHLHGWRGA